MREKMSTHTVAPAYSAAMILVRRPGNASANLPLTIPPMAPATVEPKPIHAASFWLKA